VATRVVARPEVSGTCNVRRPIVSRGDHFGDPSISGFHIRFPALRTSGGFFAAYAAHHRDYVAERQRGSIYGRAFHVRADVRAQCPEPTGQGNQPKRSRGYILV